MLHALQKRGVVLECLAELQPEQGAGVSSLLSVMTAEAQGAAAIGSRSGDRRQHP